MLVLSRKESERIKLGDSIVVTVVRLSKDKVRLGIEAPADLLVLRDELEQHGAGEDKLSANKSPGPDELKQTVIALDGSQAEARQQPTAAVA